MEGVDWLFSCGRERWTREVVVVAYFIYLLGVNLGAHGEVGLYFKCIEWMDVLDKVNMRCSCLPILIVLTVC